MPNVGSWVFVNLLLGPSPNGDFRLEPMVAAACVYVSQDNKLFPHSGYFPIWTVAGESGVQVEAPDSRRPRYLRHPSTLLKNFADRTHHRCV